MTRRWLAGIPFVLALAGSAVLRATASAASRDDRPIAAAGTQDTQEVTGPTTAVTGPGTALRAIAPHPTLATDAAGDVFNAVTAAQTAGCLPGLPAAAQPPTAPPSRPRAGSACIADTVALLSATLGQITAGAAANPDPTTMAAAATNLTTVGTAINTDECLPVSLPVRKLPLTTPPVS